VDSTSRDAVFFNWLFFETVKKEKQLNFRAVAYEIAINYLTKNVEVLDVIV